MKDSTVERLWNGMICFGLSVLVLLFSFFFSTLLLAAHDHNYAGMDVLAMSFFTLLTSFVMLRLAKSLKLFSFDLKFLTKKNIQLWKRLFSVAASSVWFLKTKCFWA